MTRSPVPVHPDRMRILDFCRLLRWIDGSPLLPHVEPYRREILTTLFDRYLPDGRIKYNEALLSRAKKNWKSADLTVMALYKLIGYDTIGGNTCFLIANDEEQAGDDLDLAKKLIEQSPHLRSRVTVQAKAIYRNDGRGELTILPAQDAVGMHGKSFVFAGYDELWAYHSWDAIEGLELDPTRPDAQRVFTSYNTVFTKRGVPLVDLIQRAKDDTDPRFFCSFYSADWTTDPRAAALDPEAKANPSRGSWSDPDYLGQQRRRLPSTRYRRLHLNLAEQPEGAAYNASKLDQAIQRGSTERKWQPRTVFLAFVDLSHGGADDACLAIAHRHHDGRAMLDLICDQGPRNPEGTFNSFDCIGRHASVLRAWGIEEVYGDRLGGFTFRDTWRQHGITYIDTERAKWELFELFEPLLNADVVSLLDVPQLEDQLLSLVWKAGRIVKRSGEHDDWANVACGALVGAASLPPSPDANDEPTAEDIFGVAPNGIPSGEIGEFNFLAGW